MTKEECPNGCNAGWRKATKTAAGSPRRQCKVCGKKWTPDPRRRPTPKTLVPSCPQCKVKDYVSKNGTVNGKQRYRCSAVGRHDEERAVSFYCKFQ